MGTSDKEKDKNTNRGINMHQDQGTTAKKRDWTTWFVIGAIVAFIIVVACIYFVKKYNATSKDYFKTGEYTVSSAEYNYYYNTIVNNFYAQNADYLLYIGIDRSKPLDDQPCLYDTNLSWKDYFDQSTVPLIQAIKAATDDAKAKSFEYDVTEDYTTYLSNISSQITSQGVNKKAFYQNAYGNYASESQLEPYVKEYLLYQAYYKKLEEDNKVTDADVKAEYDGNKENYDTVDYRLYSIIADAKDDASEDELKTAMEGAKAKADEMVERFKAGEDWRELCYEYVGEKSKDSFDPSKEADPTVIAAAVKSQISQNYSDWLYDDSRKAEDIMVYEDASNKACFVIVFDKKTAYDVEADASDIASNLATKKVSDYIDGLVVNYEISDPKQNLKYLLVQESSTQATDATEASTTAETTQTESSAETK